MALALLLGLLGGWLGEIGRRPRATALAAAPASAEELEAHRREVRALRGQVAARTLLGGPVSVSAPAEARTAGASTTPASAGDDPASATEASDSAEKTRRNFETYFAQLDVSRAEEPVDVDFGATLKGQLEKLSHDPKLGGLSSSELACGRTLCRIVLHAGTPNGLPAGRAARLLEAVGPALSGMSIYAADETTTIAYAGRQDIDLPAPHEP
jgi:hypothetical protein